MKKIKSCLVILLAAFSFLSGCGMVENGYIEDKNAPTQAPMESPYISASPLPTLKPEEKKKAETETDENAPNGSPAPTAAQEQTARK